MCAHIKTFFSLAEQTDFKLPMSRQCCSKHPVAWYSGQIFDQQVHDKQKMKEQLKEDEENYSYW